MIDARGAARRQVGGVALSAVCLGTMRLHNAGNDEAAAALLEHAFEAGVTTLHCSSEYESYPLFQSAWSKARHAAPAELAVIAKVAAPHFGEECFSAASFRAKVEAYLSALSIERLDVVQWLLRFDLKQEDARIRIFQQCADELARTVEALKQEGKIASCISFPYTDGIARAALRHGACDGLALYVNPLEHEMDRHLDDAESLGKAIVAIRPYAAGRLFTETDLGAGDAIDYALAQPAVATTVVSASSAGHLDALRPWLRPGG